MAFTEALNLLLEGEEIKCIPVKARGLLEVAEWLLQPGIHRLTLWLDDNLTCQSYNLSLHILS